MGEPITDENNEYIVTSKKNYALKGLRDFNDLNGRVYADSPDKDSITPQKRKLIEDYIFDVVIIDKKGNENIDFVDIFIRLNQNPCPISMNTFEMWNSFDAINVINKIKQIAKYKAFKQQNNRMKEEELVTTLAYMDYKQFNINNINNFFKINLRTDNKDTKREKSLIKISVRNKDAITTFLEDMEPNSKKEEEFLNSVNKVNDFIDKLKVLSENDEKILIKILNPNKPKPIKGDKNCFYIMWLILQKIDTHIIQTYKEDLIQDLKQIFKLMQNMPNNKNEIDFMEYVKNIIIKYYK